ncbi:MAG: FAD-binding oxidoreductase, partial [bacterium]|nr:FAD-binding oxidoreductase [bacterium]
ASKDICALGGMIANNCAGEKTLRYGKMENFVLESKVIFSDGKEYVVKPLSRVDLDTKMAQGDFEGNLYKEMLNLIMTNDKLIQEAKPNVTKNSAGYYLWNVVDPERSEGYFDLNKLLVGSQGTLGIVTEAKLRLMKQKTHHDMIALMFKSWDDLPEVVNAILPYEPESLETFDDKTLKLGLRFMPEIAKSAGESFLSFALRFMPEIWLGIKMIGLPKLVVLVEISEESEGEVKRKVKSIINAIKPFKVWHSIKEEDREEEKFWIMRRESFNLLRKHVRGKKTAPFIEDFCIRAEKIPEFLPRAKKILEEHGIEVNIAGHAGNGNFHIIPLMDLTQESERAKITVIADKFYDLVGQYKGTITGEHNDGIMRTPYLGKMYSQEVLALFKQTKNIFDPQNIFNPGKKVGGSIEYLESHIIKG